MSNVKTGKTRAHKNGKLAAKNVRKLSKSSAPIFFKKTLVKGAKKHIPADDRITDEAGNLIRLIMENAAVKVSTIADEVAHVYRKSAKGGKVCLLAKDAKLVTSICSGYDIDPDIVRKMMLEELGEEEEEEQGQ